MKFHRAFIPSFFIDTELGCRSRSEKRTANTIKQRSIDDGPALTLSRSLLAVPCSTLWTGYRPGTSGQVAADLRMC